MEIGEAMVTLKKHQTWRMGANVPMTQPAELSKAILTILDWWENTEDDYK